MKEKGVIRSLLATVAVVALLSAALGGGVQPFGGELERGLELRDP